MPKYYPGGPDFQMNVPVGWILRKVLDWGIFIDIGGYWDIYGYLDIEIGWKYGLRLKYGGTWGLRDLGT